MEENKDMHTEEEFHTDELPQQETSAPQEEELDPLAAAQKELEELRDTHLRLMAEYDNFRKRTLKEKAELLKSGGERVLTSFIEILDDLDLALANVDKSTDLEAVKEGIVLIHNKFVNTMKSQGVTELPTVGEEFDADKYEAIAMVPVEDAAQKGKIIDCIKKGYLLHDKVIRHPKVVVGN